MGSIKYKLRFSIRAIHFFIMTKNASKYEVKRLQRIAENRQKLQALNLPVLDSVLSLQTKRKKRKREVEEKPMEPTRKSSRQYEKRKLEKQQRKLEKRGHKNEAIKERNRLQKVEKETQKQLKMEKKREKKWKRALTATKTDESKLEVGKLCENVDEKNKERAQQWRSMDWRLRRKLQAREERREATRKSREEKKALRLKENMRLKKQKLREQKLKKKQKEKERLAQCVQRELELQRRMEEGELMREEDRLARQVAKEMVLAAKQKKMQAKIAVVNQFMEIIAADARQLGRKTENALNKEIYPVRKLELPLIHISDSIDSSKPLVLSPLLNVDVNLFHAFSLGKQFVPPGKRSVMQGICPGGFTTVYQDHVDIHVWKNAITLFLSGSTGMFYHYLFKETMHHGRKYVSFRWTHTINVTPPIMWRLCQVQKGDEFLHVNKRVNDIRISTSIPTPLLLFVQYPKVRLLIRFSIVFCVIDLYCMEQGPYIYCGRLGYLGHQVSPIEFSFQLLDINALNWNRLRTLLTSG